MLLRSVKQSDVPKLKELAEKYRKAGFELPEGNSIFYDVVLEKDGVVIAYGVLKHIAEAIMILDHSLSPKDRGEAIAVMLQDGVMQTSKLGLNELQAVCEPKFASVMKKHYGFQKLDGETLILDI